MKIRVFYDCFLNYKGADVGLARLRSWLEFHVSKWEGAEEDVFHVRVVPGCTRN